MPTIINTGSADPNYYRDQADRAARTMALFVASKRKKKEDELAKREARAVELTNAVAQGSIPPDSAHVEAAYRSLEELDPGRAADLRLISKSAFDQSAVVSGFHKEVLDKKKGYVADVLTEVLATKTPYERALIMKRAGITPDMLTPKKTDYDEPTSFEDAATGVLSGKYAPEIGQKYMDLFSDREASKNLKASRDRVYAKRYALQTAQEAKQREIDAYAAKREIDQKYEKPKETKTVEPQEGEDYITQRTVTKAVDDMVKTQQARLPSRTTIPGDRASAAGELEVLAEAVAALHPSETVPDPGGLADLIRAHLQDAQDPKKLAEVATLEQIKRDLKAKHILR